MKPEFKDYAHQIVKNAKAMADELMAQGVKLVTNGTDNHLMLIDLRPKGLAGKGKQLQNAMDKANITLNKNSVPFQKASPFNPSGLRLGTPAVTTRGMKEDEMKFIAQCIAKVVDNYKDKLLLERIRKEIMEMVRDFPIYPDFTILE